VSASPRAVCLLEARGAVDANGTAASVREVLDLARDARRLPDDVFGAATDWLWLGRSLGDALKCLLSAEEFEPWAFAPSDIPADDLANYSTATHATDASSAWWRATLDYIVEVMRREHAIWVVPDSMARPEDPFLRTYVAAAERVDTGSEVYWIARDAGPAAVESAWDSGDSAAGVMGVVSTSGVSPTETTAEELRDVAVNASHIVISAYDHSGRPIVFKRRANRARSA
jgi:hypothetical protein